MKSVRYFPLCLLFPVLTCCSSAKSWSYGDEWKSWCENSKRRCDECKWTEPNCLEVERCEEDPLAASCAGVQRRDIAMNNFCADCRQNAEKCEACKGPRESPSFVAFPALFKCGKNDAPCRGPNDNVSCCSRYICKTEKVENEKMNMCRAKSTQQRPPGGCSKKGGACRKAGDTSCCNGLSCRRSSNASNPARGWKCMPSATSGPGGDSQCKTDGSECSYIGDKSCCPPLDCQCSHELGKPGPPYQCAAMKNEPVTPDTSGECKKQGSSCYFAGDMSCCPELSCEKSSDLGINGPEYQCIALLLSQATTPSTAGECKKQGSSCSFEGDKSCCPQLSCEKSSDIGINGPEYQCIALLLSQATTPSTPEECKKQGSSCSYVGDKSCCPQLSCEKSSDIGINGPEYQCIALLLSQATTPTTASECKKQGSSCSYVGDKSCCPQLSCEKSSDNGVNGPEYQCIALLLSQDTTTASAAPIDATFSYKSNEFKGL